LSLYQAVHRKYLNLKEIPAKRGGDYRRSPDGWKGVRGGRSFIVGDLFGERWPESPEAKLLGIRKGKNMG